MIQSIELMVISRILKTSIKSEVDTLTSYDLTYFPTYRKEFEYILKHREKYNGEVPSIFEFEFEFNDFTPVEVTESIDSLESKLKQYKKYLMIIDMINTLKDMGDGDVDLTWDFIQTQCDNAQSLNSVAPMNIVQDAQKRADQIKEYNKQKRIPTGFDELDKLMYGGLSTVEELFLIVARTNAGKAQPLNAPVLTPKGWTTMGELKVGDRVVGGKADVGTILQIFPQGKVDYYRVNFDDGTSVECCDDHLWTIEEHLTTAVVPLSEIRKNISRRYRVPLCSTLTFGNKSIQARVDELNKIRHSSQNAKFDLESMKMFLRVKTIEEAEYIADLERSIGHWVKISNVDDYIEVCTREDGERRYKEIISVEYMGRTECQCILLDNKSHTYITNDYTVTHNTWFCTKVMESAQKHGFNVAYYSPEMQAAYMGTRFDTWRGHFSNSSLYKGDYSAEYLAYLRSLPLDDASAFIIEDKDFPEGVSVRKLAPFVDRHNIQLLIVDGISYMVDDQHATRDQEKYKNIATDLFKLSKKYGCAVVLVMQSNRDVKNKDDKGEAIPDLYNTENSDAPGRVATQAIGMRQIFDKHVLDIKLLKSRMAVNGNNVLSYSWDVGNGRAQFLGSGSDDYSPEISQDVTPTLSSAAQPILSNAVGPDISDNSLVSDDDEDVEF